MPTFRKYPYSRDVFKNTDSPYSPRYDTSDTSLVTPRDRVMRAFAQYGLIAVNFSDRYFDTDYIRIPDVEAFTKNQTNGNSITIEWGKIVDNPFVKQSNEAEANAQVIPNLHYHCQINMGVQDELIQHMELLLVGLSRAMGVMQMADGEERNTAAKAIADDYTKVSERLERAAAERVILAALAPHFSDLNLHSPMGEKYPHPSYFPHDTSLIMTNYVRPLLDHIESEAMDADGNIDMKKYKEYRTEWTRLIAHNRFQEFARFGDVYLYPWHNWGHGTAKWIKDTLDEIDRPKTPDLDELLEE